MVALEQAVAAPLCSVRLADAGARVIKIERPAGDTARHYDRTVAGTSAYFAWLNRGKESVVLDLEQTEEIALLRRMIAHADIFIQNLAPGATGRLGIASNRLVADHPGLIAVDIAGYGKGTTYSHMRAYDLLVQAEVGLCSITGSYESPSKVGVSVVDISTGLNAHAAILEALLERARTGRGRLLDIAMFDCVADWMSVPLAHYESVGRPTPRLGLAHASICPYENFGCRDGDIVIAVQNPAEWQRFCDGVLRAPELIQDQRFHDNPSRVTHREALHTLISKVFAALSREEAIERLESARIAWGCMSTVERLAMHPALRRMPVHVSGAVYQAVASPIHGAVAAGPVPALGAHTLRVREEFAGC